MITNWKDCLAYPIRYLFGYKVGKQRVECIDFLDLLQTIIPIEDKGNKFDSISGWLGKCYYDLKLITFSEYNDCISALANNV